MEDNYFDWEPDNLTFQSELILNDVIETNTSFTESSLDTSQHISSAHEESGFPEQKLDIKLEKDLTEDNDNLDINPLQIHSTEAGKEINVKVSHLDSRRQILSKTSVEQSSASPERFQPNLAHGLPSPPRPASSMNEFVAVYVKEEPIEEVAPSPASFQEGGHQALVGTSLEQNSALSEKIELNLPSEFVAVYIKEEPIEDVIPSSEYLMDNKHNFSPTFEESSISLFERINVNTDDAPDKEDALKICQQPDFTADTKEIKVESMHYEKGFPSCSKPEKLQFFENPAIVDVARIPGNNSEQIDFVVNESASFDIKQRPQLSTSNVDLGFGSVIDSSSASFINIGSTMMYSDKSSAQNSTELVLNKKILLFEQIPTTSTSHSGVTSHDATSAKERRFSCNQCSSTFTRRFNLKKHLKTHSDTKDFVCEQCSARFHLKSGLTRHLIIHAEKAFSCEQCSARFNQKYHLSRHLLMHSNEQVFSCEQCSVSYPRKEHLKLHMLTHSNKKPFSCDQCSAEFNYKYNLKQHILTHSDEKAFSCELCSARFTRKSNLKTHLLLHSNEKLFTCEHCSARFSQKRYLKDHLLIHSNERAFPCDECSDRFNRNRDLELHVLRTHSNQKVFSCNECSTWFKRKSNLNEHLLTHSNKKALACDFCSVKVSTKAHLKRHLLVHTTEKAFSCNQCSLSFKFKDSLRKHYKKHHAEEAIWVP